jgi:hypothetical protein
MEEALQVEKALERHAQPLCGSGFDYLLIGAF